MGIFFTFFFFLNYFSENERGGESLILSKAAHSYLFEKHVDLGHY